jgi:hypothetical protein
MSGEVVALPETNSQPAKHRGGSVNQGRHQAQCSICKSAHLDAIEQDFIHWTSVSEIQQIYTVTRYSVYRHAHAFDLFNKRAKNIRAALDKIIEQVNGVLVSGPTIISAIKMAMKMDEKQEDPDPKKVFEQMSKAEREAFASDGSLPEWFSGARAAAPHGGERGEDEEDRDQTPESTPVQ